MEQVRSDQLDPALLVAPTMMAPANLVILPQLLKESKRGDRENVSVAVPNIDSFSKEARAAISLAGMLNGSHMASELSLVAFIRQTEYVPTDGTLFRKAMDATIESIISNYAPEDQMAIAEVIYVNAMGMASLALSRGPNVKSLIKNSHPAVKEFIVAYTKAVSRIEGGDGDGKTRDHLRAIGLAFQEAGLLVDIDVLESEFQTAMSAMVHHALGAGEAVMRAWIQRLCDRSDLIHRNKTEEEKARLRKQTTAAAKAQWDGMSFLNFYFSPAYKATRLGAMSHRLIRGVIAAAARTRPLTAKGAVSAAEVATLFNLDDLSARELASASQRIEGKLQLPAQAAAAESY